MRETSCGVEALIATSAMKLDLPANKFINDNAQPGLGAAPEDYEVPLKCQQAWCVEVVLHGALAICQPTSSTLGPQGDLALSVSGSKTREGFPRQYRIPVRAAPVIHGACASIDREESPPPFGEKISSAASQPCTNEGLPSRGSGESTSLKRQRSDSLATPDPTSSNVDINGPETLDQRPKKKQRGPNRQRRGGKKNKRKVRSTLYLLDSGFDTMTGIQRGIGRG
ncbi:hypothetical protein P691DRAFT_764643 [Macrolepiota fuliginosa MF-IS2]|uniref:Uncharacterized protein n=1 Tax=Macrolepiota fuliginosa MF-IS2 TaxID=1400762 RepID=A0A9P5X3N8_9AGAR|nr:hypothetical protein P691DRAFT_764643 [Macrolepiota fuliginosa MF-IS2]